MLIRLMHFYKIRLKRVLQMAAQHHFTIDIFPYLTDPSNCIRYK